MKHEMGTLVTQAEIAELLGVSGGQVHMWAKRRARNGFPKPARYVANALTKRPLYRRAEVERWHAAYRPAKGGRPRKVVVT